MKRLTSIITITILLSITINVFAGDASGIFMNDKAAVFFGEVVSYDKTTKTIIVIPTRRIKGDIEIGLEQTFEYDYPYVDYEFIGGANPVPNDFDAYILEEGATFVMGYGGYGSGGGVEYSIEPPFDPRLFVFKPTSTDIKTLDIETWPYFTSCEHELVADWVRHYLNNGDYERAELERLAQMEQTVPQQRSTNNSYTVFYNYYLYVVLAVIICVAVLFVFRRKTNTSA